tara:strand:- start:227 stop:1138 length:912 start_codon:yes stop_codon:yes gene_type:complete
MLVPHTTLPKEMELFEELGKGSNNRVVRANLHGRECVLRAPRRRADTQQTGNAVWEFAHTMAASRCGAGPKVYKAWRAKHAHGVWPSGLYLVTEWFPYDLETLMMKRSTRDLAKKHKPMLCDQILQCLQSLASHRIFVYDLKPSNLVVRVDERRNEVTVRVIDFGRDFCEMESGECVEDHDHRAPHIAMLRKLLKEHHPEEAEREVVVTHLLFLAMLVQLSSTTSRHLYSDREEHRMGKEERVEVNPIREATEEALSKLQGRHRAVLRHLLRSDDVRGVLQHYNSRRDAGTRRTFRLARGEEF